MKVAMVLPPREGFSAGRVGAIGMIVHDLATAADDGLEPPIAAEVIGLPLQGPPLPGVTYHAAPPVALPFMSSNDRYARGVSRLLRQLRPALIEVHNRVRVATMIAAACRPTPVVLVLNNDPREMAEGRSPAQRSRALNKIVRVVCVSEYIRRCWMDGLSPEARSERTMVLMNAVDVAALPEPRGERENVILFAGRVVRDKGADTYVDGCTAALTKLPGWRAEMIGADRFRADSPETEFTSALRSRANGVLMRGYQPHAAVLEAMSRAAIVVMPSRWQDPCPLVAIEAMACGAALVTTRRGGIPEIAGDAAVYVDPESPGDLAQALIELARDPDRLGAVQRACLERSRRFDLRDAARTWNALRRQLALA